MREPLMEQSVLVSSIHLIFAFMIIFMVNSELYAANKLQVLIPDPNQPISVFEHGIVLHGEGNLGESEDRWDIPYISNISNMPLHSEKNLEFLMEIRLFWAKRAANLEIRAENKGKSIKIEGSNKEESKRFAMMRIITINLSKSICDQIVVYDPSKQWIGTSYYIRCLLKHRRNIKVDRMISQRKEASSSLTAVKKEGEVFCSKREGELWAKRLIATDMFKMKKERLIIKTPSILNVRLSHKKFLNHELRTVKHGIKLKPTGDSYHIKEAGKYDIYVLCMPKSGRVRYKLEYDLIAKAEIPPISLALGESEEVKTKPYKIEEVKGPANLVIQVYNLSSNLNSENRFDLELFENGVRKKLENFSYGNVQAWILEVSEEMHQYDIIVSSQRGKGYIRYFIQDLKTQTDKIKADQQKDNDEFWKAEEVALNKGFSFEAKGVVDYYKDPLDCWRIRFIDGFEAGAELKMDGGSKILSLEVYTAKGKLISSGSNAKPPTPEQNEGVSFFYVRMVAKKKGTNSVKYSISYLPKGSVDKFNQIIAIEKE